MRGGHFAALSRASRRLTDGWVLRLRAIGDCVTTLCVSVGVGKMLLQVGKRVANLSAYAMSHVSLTINENTLNALCEPGCRSEFGLYTSCLGKVRIRLVALIRRGYHSC